MFHSESAVEAIMPLSGAAMGAAHGGGFAGGYPRAPGVASSPFGSVALAGGKVAPISPSLPGAAGGGFVTYLGESVGGTITGQTPHTWVDDAQGLYHTSTDLAAEWGDYWQQMQAGHGASLAPWQRLEAQAEALFRNTGLGQLDATHQAAAREDVQREIDAIAGAMTLNQSNLGIDPAAKLTAQSYMALVRTLSGNAQLHELATQGHGLNAPPLARYAGYTNDIQHVIDGTTVFIGMGPDHGRAAVADFMDDAIMTHLNFPVVYQGGKLVQLNQDGDREQALTTAVSAINRTMFGKLLSAKDFATKG